MYVKISDATTGLTAAFYEALDFYTTFGYESSLTSCYDNHMANYNAHLMHSHAGFFGNLAQNPTSAVGISENGQTFIGSRLSARTITMNYKPSLAMTSDGFGSVINQLNALMEITDRPLRVDVYGSTKVFTNYFSVDPETDTESGIIQMTSAETGQGVYWSAGAIQVTRRFFEQGINYVAKDFPAPIIQELAYPMQLSYISVASAQPVFRFGCNPLQGKWDTMSITLNGVTLVYDNTVDNDEWIEIDTEALTVVNQAGTNRLDNLTVSTWPTIQAGINELNAQLNGTDNWDDAQQWLGQDMYLIISFERLTSGVE